MTGSHKKRNYTANQIESGGIKYHCDYCQKDITNSIRVRCATCSDFDLCVECFRTGKEMKTHSSDHPYRLLDKFSFPIMGPYWGADEEGLLIEAVESCGLGNWADIADHVGTKSLEECKNHYIKYYIESPIYPLPNVEMHLDEQEVEEAKKKRFSSPNRNLFPPLKTKVMPSQPANHEIQGFMPGRMEFDQELENEAEYLVKDLVFNEDDSPTEIDLKLAILDIYNYKLDKRKERKRFIFDRNFIDFKKTQANDRKRSREEKEVIQKTKQFAPLMKNTDYQSFVKGLTVEVMLRERIKSLQEYRRNGIKTLQEASEYEAQKKQRLNPLYSKAF